MYTFGMYKYTYTYIYKYVSFIFADITLILETTSLPIKLTNLCQDLDFRHYNLYSSSIFSSLVHKISCMKSRPLDDKRNFGSLKDQELGVLINIFTNHYYLKQVLNFLQCKIFFHRPYNYNYNSSLQDLLPSYNFLNFSIFRQFSESDEHQLSLWV